MYGSCATNEDRLGRAVPLPDVIEPQMSVCMPHLQDTDDGGSDAQIHAYLEVAIETTPMGQREDIPARHSQPWTQKDKQWQSQPRGIGLSFVQVSF